MNATIISRNEDRLIILTTDCGACIAVTTEDPATDFAYALTRCCAASGKGAAYSPTGVVCRACYRTVDPLYGEGACASDRDDLRRFLHRAVLAAGCEEGPISAACAYDAAYTITEEMARCARR